MTLRKTTIYDSVRYKPQSRQARERKPIIPKNKSLPGKQNKKISKKIFKMLKKIAAKRFDIFN